MKIYGKDFPIKWGLAVILALFNTGNISFISGESGPGFFIGAFFGGLLMWYAILWIGGGAINRIWPGWWK